MSGAAAFRSAHATGNWSAAAKRCLDQLGGARENENLGFLYVTDLLAPDISSILTFLRETTGIEHWVGTTGIGVYATGAQHFEEPAMAVMTAAFPADSFSIFSTITADVGAFRRDHEDWLRRAGPGLGVVHGDPRNPRLPVLVEELANASSAFLVGGVASSRGAFPQIAGDVTQGGLSGVLFAADIPVAVGLTQGCLPAGPVHTVTEGLGNVVSALDDENVLAVLAEDLGCSGAGDLADQIEAVEAAVPIPGSDTGDYLVRNLIGIDADRGLLVVGERLNVGDKLMFVRRGHEAAEADLMRMLAGLKRRLDAPPRGGIYVACVGRGPTIFADDEGESEIDIIRRELGDFPLVGFFANGEISHNRLYGYTGVLALFL
ncbi:MAG: FIST N-terminal domain-containing protein [Alphaproteobacteria bacterium]